MAVAPETGDTSVDYQVVVLSESRGGDEGGESKPLPLSIVVSGSLGSTPCVPFTSEEVTKTYRRSENDLEVFTFGFRSPDVGEVESVEIGLDWVSTGIKTSASPIFLKSLQITLGGNKGSKSSFWCNRELGKSSGMRARFFDNLGNVPIESLIWNTDEDFTRIIDRIEKGKVKDTNSSLDQILLTVEKPQYPKEEKRMERLSIIERKKSIAQLSEADRKAFEHLPGGGDGKKKSIVSNTMRQKIKRRLTLKRTVSLDMMLGKEARLLGFRPDASSEHHSELKLEVHNLKRGFSKVLSTCPKVTKTFVAECLLGTLCGFRCLLMSRTAQEVEVAEAIVSYLSLLIENTVADQDEGQSNQRGLGTVRFRSGPLSSRHATCSLLLCSELIQRQGEDWFSDEYDDFAVRVALPAALTTSKREENSGDQQEISKKRVVRETIISTVFSQIGGALDSSKLVEIQNQARAVVSIPGHVGDFLQAFQAWVSMPFIEGVESEGAFLHSRIGTSLTDRRMSDIEQAAKVACLLNGELQLDLCDAYIAIASTACFVSAGTFDTVDYKMKGEGTGGEECHDILTEQIDKINEWFVVYQFFLENHSHLNLYPLGSIVNSQAHFQLELLDLERRLEQQQIMLFELSPSKVLLSESIRAMQDQYSDKIFELLRDALSFEGSDPSDIYLYSWGSSDTQELATLKELKSNDAAYVRFALSDEERLVELKDLGILGLYLSDFKENQEALMKIGANILEHARVVNANEHFSVIRMTSFLPYKKYLWTEWDRFSDQMQKAYKAVWRNAKTILRQSYRKWIDLRCCAYATEVQCLKLKWEPVIEMSETLFQANSKTYRRLQLIKALEKAVLSDLMALDVMIRAIQDCIGVQEFDDSVLEASLDLQRKVRELSSKILKL